ncbi:ComF family protein [Chlorobium phaeobacteroides]|jgi:ComF family protein|uniref:Phosphoribosyltransferase n=1 Tax=Chlorobium phaeobacteroides (strain DSM 266 / SMG 266 / 2430) TaxID=290317 RepID=A1BIY2_CHLPD|nr:ComF family protein [Chlorobium phaeobacteroides]ABL66359.1 phosphoribosyltransferase [Chlorobium phaeobacteroides DSM 266]MBV5320035.1 ComF family protein [Chlorobium phaeobacteroides]
MDDRLLHFVYPNVCVVCQNLLLASERYLCSSCLNGFEPFSEGAAPERVFLRSIESHFGEDSLFERAWCRYVFHKNSALQQAVHAMKYQGMFNLGIFFGKEIGRYIAASGMDCDAIDCIVPVPLNRLKLIERSFNQAEKIAEGMAAVLHKPVEPRMLRRVTYTSSQTGLTLAQRKKNLAGAFEPGKGRIPRRVILVDDIVTTGATMVAAAQALQKGGAETIHLAALALAAKE